MTNKDLYSLILSILFLFGSCQVVSAMPHHQLVVDIDPAHSTLRGEDTITLQKKPEGPLTILLSAGAEELKVRAGNEELAYTRSADKIEIAHAPAVLQIDWTLHLDAAGLEEPKHHEDPTYGVFAAISEKGSYLAEGGGWHPRLEGLSASHDLVVTLPDGHWAVAAGRMAQKAHLQGQNQIRWTADYPLSGLSLAAGPWVIRENVVGGIPIYAFFYKNSIGLADTYLSKAREYINLYEALFGPYPFHKFAIVENFLPTGYGFPSWTLLGSRVIKLPFIVKTSLGHEVAHNWWGNGVYADLSKGNWAEGLTTYVADYLYKEQEGPDSAEAYRLKVQREYSTLVEPSGLSLTQFRMRTDKASQAVGYGKSAMVFHSIRQRIGDVAFWRGLKNLAESHMFKEVDWYQILDEFSRQSNQEISRIYRPWIERDDIPQLELISIKSAPVREGWKISGQLRQLSSVYSLRLDVLIETTGGPVTSSVALDEKSLSFALTTPSRPLKIIFDPQHHLMRRLAAEEIPVTINSLRAAHNLFTIVSDQLSPDQVAAAKGLLTGLRKPLKLYKGDFTDPKSSYLFVFPPEDLPAPVLAPQLTRDSDGNLLFKGDRVNETEVLFFVWQPANQGLRALFIPGGAAAERTAVKIPHYGKYSYLGFREAKNNLKGIWQPAHSSLEASLD